MAEVKPRIQQLKEQAKELGIDHSPNIGADTLDNKIKGHLAQLESLPSETAQSHREKKVKQATRLRRVIVTCQNQTKTNSDRQGEIVMASNSVVGTLKKFFPYGYPTHLEQMLVNVLEEKKYQQFFGPGNTKSREVKEFSIDYLPDLTPEEVQDLKKMQAIRAEAANL